ncbi:MAG: ATP-dependent helicase [Bacilli bacterium]|nr:ATP-dependent helicase [Bacilli bacterium]
MDKLNKKQELAVKTTEGYIRVIAGAGSGKTRTITKRYIYLVNELGISNSNILCITFTNNAAEEMKRRINKEVKDNDVGYICTFHSLAVRALREDINCINVVNNFTILDSDDKLRVLKKIYKTLNITNRDYHYADMLKAVDIIKNKHIDYIEYLGKIKSDYFINPNRIEEKFFNKYIEEQRQNAMLDYFDLISVFEYILTNNADKRIKWQERFQYIMCDEFNDVDARQFNILRILSDYHKNLMIVGDPDQTIYSWRGSDIKYIIEFKELFENVQDIVIDQNYRSVPSILKIANSLIVNNKTRLEKNLIPTRKEENKVVFCSLKTEQEEAIWIVEQIKKILNSGEAANDIAIIYKNNDISRSIEEQLMLEGIKYRIYGGVNFYSRKEIKDIISYLRFIVYEKDFDFERIINVPKRGIGKKSLDVIKDYAENNKCSLYEALKKCLSNETLKKIEATDFIKLIDNLRQNYKNMSIVELVNFLDEKIGYQEILSKENEQDRIENIEELKHSIIEFENSDLEGRTLEEYLDKISLYTDNDRVSLKDGVKLMTIHASKGMEFKNLFVCRVNEGILPSGKVKTQEYLEEERRVFYVAITRAKDRLYLSEIQKSYGQTTNIEPSRFLYELDKSQLEYVDEISKERLLESMPSLKEKRTNIELQFKVGEKIRHSVFGEGIIENVNLEDKTYSIKFDKFNTSREISAHIKLDKI